MAAMDTLESVEVRHWGDLLSARSTSSGIGQNPEYLISGYLDSGKNNLLLHPHSEILCGAALPGAFSSQKKLVSFLL